MTKVFLILAILASAAGAFFTWQNKTAFEEVHSENKDLAEETKGLKAKHRKASVVFEDTKAELSTEENAREEASTRVEILRGNLKRRTDRIGAQNAKLRETNTQIDEFNTILGGIGVTNPDELNTSLEEETDKSTDLTAQIDEQKVLIEGLKSQVNDKRGVLSGLRKAIADRAEKFNVKTRRARISAVDPAWSFAVINIGNTAGINVNDRVIVERGGQRVGLLVIKSVERTQIVADIVPGASDGNVQVGDSVVFDSQDEQS